jgi:glycosyltransferase involved in cell wall biosynthesis
VVVRSEHLPYLLTDSAERLAYRQALQFVDRVVCVSQEVYNTHLAAGVPAEKLSVVRNGISVPTPVPDRAGVRARLGLMPEAKVVLTVARMTEQKGHTYLLAAVPAILASVPEAHFVWVGDGPLAGALHAQMEGLGIAPPRVIFAGRRSDVPDLLAACDVFVLPSLYEGLPLVVLEALANGALVVGTRVCGTSEAIEDGVTGRLVPARESGALAAAVIEALTQEARVARWRRAGRARIAGAFSARRMAAEVAAIYEALAAGPAAGPGAIAGEAGTIHSGGQHGQGADWLYRRGGDRQPARQ